MEVSHLSLTTGPDLVINGRRLRLIQFLVQVLKTKYLRNRSSENEAKRKKNNILVQVIYIFRIQSPSAKIWRMVCP
jgi:hypothetical protein